MMKNPRCLSSAKVQTRWFYIVVTYFCIDIADAGLYQIVYTCVYIYIHIPSGKRLHNYGKSPFSMGKSTISTGPFSIAMFVYQRVYIIIYHYNSATFDDGKSHGKSMKWTAKAQGCEIPCSINGHFRNRETLEVPSIYKAYFSGLCKGIYPQNMAIWYSTSNLGSWNSHWLYVPYPQSTPMQHVIPHVYSFLLSSPMKIAHVDPYVPNVSVKKQQKTTVDG